MTRKEAQKRAAELSHTLREWQRAYFVESRPLASDAEYDRLFDELAAIELEVSVLDPPVELPDPSGFVAGRHGIVVERGMRRALLLPQVATEQGWDEVQMLEAVCRKANLPADAWRDASTRLSVFDSTCFDEAAVRAESPAG